MKFPALFLMALAPMFAPTIYAQQQPTTEFNLVAEADGFKARVTDARWVVAEDYRKGYEVNGDKRARVFVVSYEILSDEKPFPYTPTLALLSNTGRRISSWGSSTSGTKGSAVFRDLDPRMRDAAFEWTLTKRATPEATGQFPLSLDFGDVAYPAAGATTEVNKTITTPRGTRVTLLSVARAGKMGQHEDQIVLRVKMENPPNVPDLTASLGLDPRGITDDKGVDLVGNRSQNFYERDGALTTMVEDAPAPGATALKIKIIGSEVAPSLAVPNASKVVTLKFDPSSLPKPPADDRPLPTPVATGSSPALDVSLTPFDQGRTTLWFRDKRAGAANRSWEVASWLAGERTINTTMQEPPSWKENGVVPAPDESAIRLYVSPADPLPIPATIAFRPIRSQSALLNFKDVTFPATAGETLDVNRTIALEGGGVAVLSRVFRFDAEHPLKGAMGIFRNPKREGLAFVVEYRSPDAGTPAALRRIALFELHGAQDDAGREVKGASPDGQMQYNAVPGDATLGDAENSHSTQTWLRAIPATGAKSISFQGSVVERVPDGNDISIAIQ